MDIRCKTQAGAIAAATLAAKDEAESTGQTGEAIVLLKRGETMIITARCGGRVRRQMTPGWVMGGDRFMSRHVGNIV